MGVVFFLLCLLPSFTISQRQDDADATQSDIVSSVDNSTLSLGDVIQNLAEDTTNSSMFEIDDDDDLFGYGNFSDSNEITNLTITSDLDDDDDDEDLLSFGDIAIATVTESYTDDLAPNSIDPDVSNDKNDIVDDDTGEDPPAFETVEKDRKDDVYPVLDPSANATDSMKGNALSLGAIIGIAIGCTVLVIGTALLVYYTCFSNKPKKGHSDDMAPSPRKNNPWMRNGKRKNSPTSMGDSIAERSLLRSEHSNDDKNLRNDIESSDLASSTGDVESHAMYSYNQSYADSGSIYTNGSTIKVHSTHSYGNDNTSYAYSLEPGIEASVVGIESMNSLAGVSEHGDDSSIPIREIPHVSMKGGKTSDTKTLSTSEAENKKHNFNYDHFGKTQIENIPSELKLTKSELAMLPSNLRSSDDENEHDIDISNNFQADQNKNTLTRKVLAPAGRLGVIIDTTVKGPVVHKVNQESKLVGKIFPGDIIIAIDDVDTRAMSASDINAVMVKTANQNRRLTILGAS